MKQIKRIVLILISISAAVCMSSCQKSSSMLYEEKEKTAEALMLQHKYVEAAEEMEKLGDYEKAVKFAGYCRGLDAGEKGEFENAAKLFQPLGEYRDSDKMFVYYTARACESKAAEAGSDQAEQYLTAAETYKDAGSFRDSEERAENCYQAVYAIAAKLTAQKQYENAEKIYIKLDKFLDSASLALKARADALYETGDLVAASDIYNTLDQQYQTHADDYQEQYANAVSNIEQKQYDKAREILTSLGNYKNCQILLQDCIYLEATDLLDGKQYDEAAALFDGLDYKDSSSLSLECSYRKALDLATDCKYKEAALIFSALDYYKDCREQLERLKADEMFDSGDYAGAWLIYSKLGKNCQTHQNDYEEYFAAAEKLREEGMYDEARQWYSALGTYGGADELAIRCLYEKAKKYEKENHYTEALVIYKSIQDQERIDACRYQYGIFLLENKKYTAAAVQFARCPDYQDSNEQRYMTGVSAFHDGDLKAALEILQDDKTHDGTAEILYEIAAAASEKQEYELAISAYDCIGDYQDARHERTKNYMLWADQLFEEGEYNRYIQVISALGDSENTRDMIRKAKYAKAKKLMEDGAYERAKAELQELNGYEDSSSLMKDCEYELASRMYAQGEYQEALAAFEKGQMTGYRDADEMITDCRYQIGRINETASDYQVAAELYEMCGAYLDSRERWLECCFLQAVTLKDQLEYDDAVQWFVKARKHNNTIEQMNEMIKAYDSEGKKREADYARQMILWIRAENALDNQVYEDAVSYYKQIIDPAVIKEREKEANYCFGEELMSAGEYRKAAEMFAVADDYSDASEKYKTAMLEEGNTALEGRDYKKARKCFTEAGDESRIILAWITEAESYMNAGNYEQARACFKEAGNEDKIDEAWNTEAEVYLAAGNYEQARACFQEADNDDRITATWIAEAESRLQSGQYANARRIYETIGLNEKIPEIWNLEGEACLAVGQYAQAKDAFKTAGNQSRYEDTVFEEAKAYIAAKEYGPAYELLKEIQIREDVQNILHTEKAFLLYRINLGDIIVFGTYEQDNNEENGQELIEWIVLATDNDYHALVLSRYGLDCQPYNQKKAHVTWQTCTLRAWLNYDFYEIAFSKDEREAILTKETDNSSRQCNSAWGISGGENTSDKVFLLSYKETEEYLPDDLDRMCIPTDYAIARNAYTKKAGTEEPQLNCWWWLRSPGSSLTRASRVGTNGSRAEDDVKQKDVCIRPVLWLDLTAVNF